MNFADLVAADIRRCILRVLAEDADYSHNEYVLREALGYFGHKISLDRLRTELAWLSEQGLVEVRDNDSLQVARLTVRGSDVARGRTVVPGVKRPEPGEC